MIRIGIDPGINTGIAVFNMNTFKLEAVRSMTILEAMDYVLEMRIGIEEMIIEDATQVKYRTKKAQAQGAGSIKRDCKIWMEFVKKYNIKARFIRTKKKITKIKAEQFKRITKWKGATNEHGRDAAMILLNN